MKIRTIHIVLATTLFALLLWFSVSMSDQYQLQVTAPLEVRELPPGKAIGSPMPREVKLTFNDYGWRLAKLAWGPAVEWVIDLSALPPRQKALTLRDVGEQFGNRLGVKPIAMYPETLFVDLDSLGTKRVPLELRFILTFPEGFAQIGSTVVKPESVTITGALRLLRRVHSWPTVERTFAQVRQDFDDMVPLSDSIPSLTLTPDRVSIRVFVQQVAEKMFHSLTVEVLSVPQNREVILGFPRIDVVVRGGIDQLAVLRQDDIRASVDYRDILADTTGVIEPGISLPGGVRLVKKSPERLQYVVRKK